MSWILWTQIALLIVLAVVLGVLVLAVYVAGVEAKSKVMAKQRRWEIQAQAHISSPLSVPAPWEYLPGQTTSDGTVVNHPHKT